MKIRIWASTNKVGSKVEDVLEIDDADLEGMTEETADSVIDDMARQMLYDQLIDWGWEKVK